MFTATISQLDTRAVCAGRSRRSDGEEVPQLGVALHDAELVLTGQAAAGRATAGGWWRASVGRGGRRRVGRAALEAQDLLLRHVHRHNLAARHPSRLRRTKPTV